MDEGPGLFIIVLIVLLVLPLAFFGIILIVGVGVLVGIAYLLYHLGKRLIALLEAMEREREQQRLLAIEEERVKALRAAEEIKRQELEQQQLAEKRRQTEQEQEIHRAEQLRLARAEAARQKLETEREEADRLFTQWTGGAFTVKPSHEQIDTIIDETTRIVSRCGRHLHILLLVGCEGVALQWKAHLGMEGVPKVVGLRGNEQMFSEWALLGRHTAHLAPGRHVMEFHVIQSGQTIANDPDVAFEIYVPEYSKASALPFAEAVNAAAEQFIQQATTVATAKRKAEEVLMANSTDPDEVAQEMSRLEVQIKELRKEQESP